MSDGEAILVTGGAGFIGSHTCKALAQSGFTPVVYDNLERGHESFVKWGPLVRGDILDQDKLIETIAEFKPAAVIHFAAHAYVGESVEHPQKYYQNNFAGTLSLLSALKTGKLPIVFSSSCAVYGLSNSARLTEEHPKQPINPYGFTKLAC